MRIELHDVARVPQRHPDVVVPVRDDAVHDGVMGREWKYRHLPGLPVVLAQRTAHDPADVNVVLGIEGQRLRPLDRISDDVVGIEWNEMLEFFRLRIESKQTLRVR